jgi:hypothetical protein
VSQMFEYLGPYRGGVLLVRVQVGGMEALHKGHLRAAMSYLRLALEDAPEEPSLKPPPPESPAPPESPTGGAE